MEVSIGDGRGSNPRPLGPQPSALDHTELPPHLAQAKQETVAFGERSTCLFGYPRLHHGPALRPQKESNPHSRGRGPASQSP